MFNLYIDLDLDGQFNSFLNCGTPQSIGDPTFEILYVEPNPFVSSYSFATPNPSTINAHPINHSSHDTCALAFVALIDGSCQVLGFGFEVGYESPISGPILKS